MKKFIIAAISLAAILTIGALIIIGVVNNSEPKVISFEQLYPRNDLESFIGKGKMEKNIPSEEVSFSEFRKLFFKDNIFFIEPNYSFTNVYVKLWGLVNNKLYYTQESRNLSFFKKVDEVYPQLGGGLIKINFILKPNIENIMIVFAGAYALIIILAYQFTKMRAVGNTTRW